MNDPIAIGDQAAAAWDRFMGPALAVCRQDYEKKLTKLYGEIDTDQSIRARSKLALALRVLDEVEGQIKSLTTDGRIALEDQRRADRVANLPAYKKLGIGLA